MQELITKVEQWAEDRNLIQGSIPSKQIQKTAEELMELAVAVGKDELLAELRDDMSDFYYHRRLERVSAELADAVGDTLVTLLVVCKQLGLSIEDCLLVAYDQIKDRKGKMVNGKFVKENS